MTSPVPRRQKRTGPRGAATWLWAPRRIHVGSHKKYPLFSIYLINLNL